MIDKAVNFIKNCNEKTAIIYDIDGDSIGSAIIVAKTIERLFDYIPTAFIINHELFTVDKGIYKEVIDKKVKNVIIVDVAIDETPEYVLKIDKKVKILILDHHQVHRDLNKFSNIIHVNPYFWNSKVEPVKYCTSKLTYDICSRITDIEDLVWLAGLGIINDYCGEQWKDFLDKLYEKYPILKKGKEPYSFESNFGLIDHIVTSGYYHSGLRGGKIAYEACLEASSPLDLLEARTSKAKTLMEFYCEVQEEINKVMSNWRKYAEIHEDKKLVFLELKTRFAIKSPISTMLGIRNPNYTFIIFREKGNFIQISLRREDGKVDCGKLAEFATKNLENANGGGHAPAAGANIMANDLEKFKENVLKYLRT
jgi:oligoribonuclease NrnB/cAMP/cGMP phosphodiesterase (DHH superfamily)